MLTRVRTAVHTAFVLPDQSNDCMVLETVQLPIYASLRHFADSSGETGLM